MNRRTARILFVCVCVMTVLLAGVISAAAGNPDQKPQQKAGDGSPLTTTTYTGKFVVSWDITFTDTYLPSGDTIGCEVTVNLTADQGTDHYIEKAAQAGTRSGNSGHCTVTLAYAWQLTDEPEDIVELTYVLAVPPEGTGQTPVLPFRENDQFGLPTHVPANGATTNITLDATL